jgi:hypothetical protein
LAVITGANQGIAIPGDTKPPLSSADIRDLPRPLETILNEVLQFHHHFVTLKPPTPLSTVHCPEPNGILRPAVSRTPDARLFFASSELNIFPDMPSRTTRYATKTFQLACKVTFS